MKLALTVLLLATALDPTTRSAAAADRYRIELTDPERPPVLEVEIEWGSIRLSAHTRTGDVAVVSRPDAGDELQGAPVTVSEADNTVSVRQAALPSGVFRSAHLEIEVPFRTSVALKVNRGGDVWVEEVAGLIEVTNLNGSVELIGVSGAAAVNASNGSIQASFVQVEPGRDMFFGSLNGSVELCLPPDYTARVDLTTAGDPIRSAFPVERDAATRVVGPGETSTADRSEVRGRIGSGGARLRVSTLNGEIRLDRCEQPSEPDGIER